MAEPIPEISVIIPAYNAAETITRQLHAVVSQETRSRVEILVVDNGSNDGTATVVEEFAGLYPDVFLVSAPDTPGAGYARNQGAAAAKGRFLLFCDADDLICAGWINAHVATLEHSSISLGVTRNSYGPCNPDDFDLPFSTEIPKYGPYPKLASGNFGIRPNDFRAVDGFDTRLLTGEDADFGVRAFQADMQFVVSPDAKLLRGVVVAPMRRFRRAYQYGRGRYMVCQKHPLYPRPNLSKDCWFLISRAPVAVFKHAHRDAWMTTLGADLGFLRGAFSPHQHQLDR